MLKNESKQAVENFFAAADTLARKGRKVPLNWMTVIWS